MAASLNQDDAHSNVSSRSNLKRPRSHNSAAAAAVTRFKGVVPQISGHWGAQIYANHQRVWLGTFKSEKEAAMAYDSAAIKLRSGDSHRNFPWSPLSLQEPVFQKHCTTEAVLCMIKDGSYATKFSEFLNQQSQADQSGDRDPENNNTASSARSFFLENINNMMKMRMRVNGMEKFSCRKLFRKELTPSDVGKLNRLVIPKKFAVKYFPVIISDQARAHGDNDKDVLLSFYDPLVRLWKFRYCYWKSSQSFVFTRGWNKFVKEKELKAKDVITFFLCEGDEGVENENSSVTDRKPSSSFYVMDVSYSAEKNEEEKEDDEQEHVEENADSKTSHVSEIEVAEEKEADGCGSKKKSFRLFGVDILQN